MLSVIHEILAHHRQLESKWHTKKIKLHQRLALRLFQEDVKQVGNKTLNTMKLYLSVAQVLDWLEKHGEVFLRKNVGIGRNLAKSRAYQKSHETFEGVVQVGGSRILLHRNTELKSFGKLYLPGSHSGLLLAHLSSHLSSAPAPLT